MSGKSVELSQAEINEKVEEFREWIETQPDLPRTLGINNYDISDCVALLMRNKLQKMYFC